MATTQSNSIDWEMPEYQNALKMVIKYEIQSLLERLSETGEETVLLTANTTDLCVGHLASERGKRFLSTTEVGEMKNKFLYFCTVEGAGGGTNETGIKVTVLPQKNASPPGRGRGRGGRGRPRGSTTGSGRRSKQAAAQFQAGKPVVGSQGQGPLTGLQGQGDISHRLALSQHSAGQGEYSALSDTEMATKFSNVKAQSSVKSGQKRQQQFTAEEIQNMIVSAETKRRKVDLEKQTLSPQSQKMAFNQPDKNKSTVQKVDNLPQNKQQFLVSDDDSNDYYGKQAHHEPRLSHDDSKIGGKGAPFSQENSEFHKFLEQYNAEVSKKFAGDDSEYEDEYDEEDELEEYGLMGNKLEKGEIPQSEHFDSRTVSAQGQMLVQTSQSHFTPSQFQRQFQNFQKNNQSTVYQNLPAMKNQAKSGTNEFDPHIEIKEELETEGYGDNVLAPVNANPDKDPKSKDKEPQISLQTIISKATKKLTEPGQNKQPSSSNEAQGIPEIKEEADPHDLDYKQKADSSTSGLKQQADSSNQRVDTSPRDSEVQQPDTTQQNKGPQTSISQGPGSRPPASGEITKSQDMAEADVSEKLKMLSKKLSWVVEFPKNFEQGQQQQPQPSNYPPVEEHEYIEDYEENEEEEYEEDELDEDELAALRQYQEAQRRHQSMPPELQQHAQGQQQFQQRFGKGMGHVGDEYDEEDDYDEEEMEHLGDEEEDYEGEEYGEVDSEDERTLRELGILGAQGNVHGRLQHGNMKLPPPGGTLKPGQQGQIHKEIFNQRALETDIGKHLFPKTSSEMDNFILMGAMAKCLICNKLVRKSDMVQHNLIHAQEEEGDEEELDEMHEEFDEMGEEMDEMHGEMHGEMGEMHEEMDEMHGEGHAEMLGENDEELLEEDHEEMQGLPEGLQESHGDELKGMGNEMHGEMQEMIGAEGEEVNPEDLGEEEYEPELTAEKVTAETMDPDDKTCNICNKPFRNKSALIKHLKTHDPKDLKCEFCSKTFRLQSYLEKHQKKMHPNAVFQQEFQQEMDKREGLDCALCKKTFQSKQEIEQHMMSSHA